MKLFILFVLSLCGTLACDTTDGDTSPAVRIEAPGARIVVDNESGVVDIQADGARVYADKTGRVEIVAAEESDEREGAP